MLIMTCFFVHDPFTMDSVVIDKMFGTTESSLYSERYGEHVLGGHVGQAYAFAIFMHVFLASLSLFKTCAPEDWLDRSHRAYKSTQLVAVLLEVGNFCKLLQMYGYSQMNHHVKESKDVQ
jgi:hypothetical protein